jgi:hypothetical protein
MTACCRLFVVLDWVDVFKKDGLTFKDSGFSPDESNRREGRVVENAM